MEKEKIVGKEAVKLLQYTEYGDFYIKTFDLNFLEHIITMLVVAAPYDEKEQKFLDKQYMVRFINVSKFKLRKDGADEPWEVIGWAYLWYLPEDKDEMNLTKQERKEIEIEKYDFMIEGDFFDLFIKGNLEVEPYEKEQS